MENKFKFKNALIFFGAKGSCVLKQKDKNLTPEQFRNLTNPEIKLLRQTHSSTGKVVDTEFESFSEEGDFLTTNNKNLKIGIKTADCTPIVFYNPVQNCIGIAHAGWKGTTAKIAANVVNKMAQEFASKSEDLFVWVGPSAKTCCYEVGKDFYKNLDNKWQNSCLKESFGKIYFDLQNYNKLALLEAGIQEDKINLQFNECTICNTGYGSYRREGENTLLQISYIVLE